MQHESNDHPRDDASLEKDPLRRSPGSDGHSGIVHFVERGDCGCIFGVAVEDKL